jgi:hypothetical protein
MFPWSPQSLLPLSDFSGVTLCPAKFPWSPQSLLLLSDFSGVTLCPAKKCIKLSLLINALKTSELS